ncbi:MAG: hypothetical protein V7767_00515 [Leeuwenhoekiella sp.]
MNFYHNFFEQAPWILRLNFILSLCFLFITLAMVGFMLYLRLHKNVRARRKKFLDTILIEFVNSYLFDEDFDKKAQTEKINQKHLKTDFDRKMAIKQILMFNENLKGESTLAIKELFINLNLYQLVLRDLKNRNWHKKARALFVFSQLSVEVPTKIVEPLLNDKKGEVRQQALLYFLKLSVNNPLGFLDKIKRPLTRWQQIYIENGLKYAENIVVPDFSKWLNHNLDSVVSFCIRMIAEFNQFENIDKLMPFIAHEKEEVKLEAINSLCRMEDISLIPILISRFDKESIAVKSEILKVIKSIGSYEDLKILSNSMNKEKWNIKIEYHRVACHFKPELKHKIFSKKVGLDKSSFTPPLLQSL